MRARPSCREGRKRAAGDRPRRRLGLTSLKHVWLGCISRMRLCLERLCLGRLCLGCLSLLRPRRGRLTAMTLRWRRLRRSGLRGNPVCRDLHGRLLFAARDSYRHLGIGGKRRRDTQVDLAFGGRKPHDTARKIAFHPGLQLGARLKQSRRGSVAGSLGQRRCTHRFNHHTISGWKTLAKSRSHQGTQSGRPGREKQSPTFLALRP